MVVRDCSTGAAPFRRRPDGPRRSRRDPYWDQCGEDKGPSDEGRGGHGAIVQWSGMLRVLDRYMIKDLAPPFALAVGLLTFFLVIDRVYQLTDLVITKSVPFHFVLGLLLFMLPGVLALTVPMALLVSVLLVCCRLAGDLEVAALKASGVGPLRLFRPFLGIACLVSGAVAGLTLLIAPAASGAFQNQLFQILQTKATTGIKERTFTASF